MECFVVSIQKKTKAVNNYSRTKIKAEKEIKNYSKSLIIRTLFWFFRKKYDYNRQNFI